MPAGQRRSRFLQLPPPEGALILHLGCLRTGELITVDDDGRVMSWDLTDLPLMQFDSQRICNLPWPVDAVDLASVQHRLVAASGNRVTLFDLGSGSLRAGAVSQL